MTSSLELASNVSAFIIMKKYMFLNGELSFKSSTMCACFSTVDKKPSHVFLYIIVHCLNHNNKIDRAKRFISINTTHLQLFFFTNPYF